MLSRARRRRMANKRRRNQGPGHGPGPGAPPRTSLTGRPRPRPTKQKDFRQEIMGLTVLLIIIAGIYYYTQVYKPDGGLPGYGGGGGGGGGPEPKPKTDPDPGENPNTDPKTEPDFSDTGVEEWSTAAYILNGLGVMGLLMLIRGKFYYNALLSIVGGLFSLLLIPGLILMPKGFRSEILSALAWIGVVSFIIGLSGAQFEDDKRKDSFIGATIFGFLMTIIALVFEGEYKPLLTIILSFFISLSLYVVTHNKSPTTDEEGKKRLSIITSEEILAKLESLRKSGWEPPNKEGKD